MPTMKGLNMPENKEELFGLLEEFDEKARLVERIIIEYNKDDLIDFEKSLLNSYCTCLERLVTERDTIDKTRSILEKYYASRES